MPKLTKPLINALSAQDRDVVVWDSSMPGFGMRIKSSGVKSFIVQYRNKSGRSRRVSIGRLGVLTLDQARKEAIRLLGDVAKGKDPAEERRVLLHGETVAQLAAFYMKEHCEGRCKPRTIAAHNWLLEKFVLPRLGSRKLLDLRPADISKLHADLKATPYNANRALGLLRAMLNHAERREMIPRGSNPAALITPYPEKKRERYLSPAELQRLLETLETMVKKGTVDIYEDAAIRLLLYTGCRLSEITTLEWASIDFDKARLVLKQHKTDRNGAKIIPLNAPALQLLRSIPKVKHNPYVIVGRVPGGHLINLQKPWRRIRKQARLDDVRLHDLRHSFASFAIGAGIPLAIIGGLLGHRSVQTTARYAHLADDPLQQASAHIGTLFDPKATVTSQIEKNPKEPT